MLEEADGGEKRVERECALRCVAERKTGALTELFRLLSGRPGKLERGTVVVSEHLGAILGALCAE